MKYNPKKIDANILMLEMALGYAVAAKKFYHADNMEAAAKFQHKHMDWSADYIEANTTTEAHAAILESDYQPMNDVRSEWERRAEKQRMLRETSNLVPVHFGNGFRIAPTIIVEAVDIEGQTVLIAEPVTHV